VPARPRPPLRVGWEGHYDGRAQGSWALVNARLLPVLRDVAGLQVDAYDPVPGVVEADPGYGVWVTHYYPPLAGHDAWPLPPTNARRWVCWVAWEHGPVPPAWEEAWRLGGVAEVWVPSEHARRLVLGSTALQPARVRVVPYGVDTEVFHPEAAPWPRDSEAFRVLYVGGPLWRKGVDLAIEAYDRAFSPSDPVRLILKLQGADTFYRDAPAVRPPKRPYQVVKRDDLSDAEMAGLMTACDVLVAPYRAEGFCLPVLEAMACGLPVVHPAHGPAPEYTGGGVATIAVPLDGGEPDVMALARALRWLWKHPEERARMGEQARSVALGLDWRHVAQGVAERLAVVARSTGDAFTRPAEASA
jgi:glycosyltransferase involved in cell wall biosynthesis